MSRAWQWPLTGTGMTQVAPRPGPGAYPAALPAGASSCLRGRCTRRLLRATAGPRVATPIWAEAQPWRHQADSPLKCEWPPEIGILYWHDLLFWLELELVSFAISIALAYVAISVCRNMKRERNANDYKHTKPYVLKNFISYRISALFT